jgi:multiple sugar transport system substrate-binding protein
LGRSGPDISEVGTTWIDSFVSMDALRQFNQRELANLGGPKAFLPSFWRSGTILGRSQVRAVPWLADTRVVCYRRDLLQNAGLDEQTAFTSIDQLEQTLQYLQESGVEMPLAIPTAQKQTILHVLAPWVWQAGGHFITTDGKTVTFNHPEAQAGMRTYFYLRRFLVPPAHHLTDQQTGNLFRQGQAAVIISGHWMLSVVTHQEAQPDVVRNFGMAVVPGVPFVGGSNLVVWKHSRQPEAAIALAQYLTAPPFQTDVITKNGLLPARLEVLMRPPFTTDPYYGVIGDSLRKGHGFQATYLWGLIEDKLATTLVRMWQELLDNPNLDIDETITRYLDPLAEDLNRTLSS